MKVPRDGNYKGVHVNHEISSYVFFIHFLVLFITFFFIKFIMELQRQYLFVVRELFIMINYCTTVVSVSRISRHICCEINGEPYKNCK